MNLYLTADKVGGPGGGPTVTLNESEALKSLGPCEVWHRDVLRGGSDPWGWDEVALNRCGVMMNTVGSFKLCHIYAGCFANTVSHLRKNGCKVVYTVAAHDVPRSKQAHEEMGIPFNYPHLTDSILFQRYIWGYMEADVVVCPSTVAAETVRRQGRKGRIEVIPHGIDLPKCKACLGKGYIVWALDDGSDGYQDTEHEQCEDCSGSGISSSAKPFPKMFTVGYLGAYGCDKGVVDLMRAWKKLGYTDAVLVLAGRDSEHNWVRQMWEREGGGNVVFAGWQESLSEFYGALSIYCQPSRTEGFGIEVLEALAHGRPVVCSDQAGAVDVVRSGCGFNFRSGCIDELAERIDQYKQGPHMMSMDGGVCTRTATDYRWDRVRGDYISLWKELLA